MKTNIKTVTKKGRKAKKEEVKKEEVKKERLLTEAEQAGIAKRKEATAQAGGIFQDIFYAVLKFRAVLIESRNEPGYFKTRFMS